MPPGRQRGATRRSRSVPRAARPRPAPPWQARQRECPSCSASNSTVAAVDALSTSGGVVGHGAPTRNTARICTCGHGRAARQHHCASSDRVVCPRRDPAGGHASGRLPSAGGCRCMGRRAPSRQQPGRAADVEAECGADARSRPGRDGVAPGPMTTSRTGWRRTPNDRPDSGVGNRRGSQDRMSSSLRNPVVSSRLSLTINDYG